MRSALRSSDFGDGSSRRQLQVSRLAAYAKSNIPKAFTIAMQFRLRPLLIVLAVGPPMIAGAVMWGPAAVEIMSETDSSEFVVWGLLLAIPIGLAWLFSLV